MNPGPSLGLRTHLTDLHHYFDTGRDETVRAGRFYSHFHAQKVGSVGLYPDNGQLCPTALTGFTKLLLVNLCHLLVKYKVTGRVTNLVTKRSVISTVHLCIYLLFDGLWCSRYLGAIKSHVRTNHYLQFQIA